MFKKKFQEFGRQPDPVNVSEEEVENDSEEITSKVAETVISLESSFNGTLTGKTPVRIEGYFEGEIKDGSSVVVEETGRVVGKVSCDYLLVWGHVEGSVKAYNLLDLTAVGQIKGDVEAKRFIMVDGAILEGSCKMLAMNEERLSKAKQKVEKVGEFSAEASPDSSKSSSKSTGSLKIPPKEESESLLE